MGFIVFAGIAFLIVIILMLFAIMAVSSQVSRNEEARYELSSDLQSESTK